MGYAGLYGFLIVFCQVFVFQQAVSLRAFHDLSRYGKEVGSNVLAVTEADSVVLPVGLQGHSLLLSFNCYFCQIPNLMTKEIARWTESINVSTNPTQGLHSLRIRVPILLHLQSCLAGESTNKGEKGTKKMVKQKPGSKHCI